MKTSVKIHKVTNLKQTERYSVWNLKIPAISLFLIVSFTVSAQTGLTIYTDAGKNNVSEGLFIKSAFLGHYEFGKNRIETGFEINLKNNNNLLFSGYTISTSRKIMSKGFPSELEGFCTWTRNSEFLRETNWGVLLKFRHNRFEMKIGTNFRTYAFRSQAIMDYGMDKRAIRIHENFNIMYSFSYYIKQTDDQWNAGLSVTNIDRFIINQETNPELSLRALYKPGSRICLYSELWYKTAGATNLAINHFGFYIRTGLIWNFN